jgi:hypothetical protein
MRLLKLEEPDMFSLVEFFGDKIPRYAILSHTWGQTYEEVTFKDIVKGTGKSKVGFEKIRFCVKQASNDGLEYSWVDTCCINKSSSSELSESINSMYQWYKNAEKCYVYLSDVSTHDWRRPEYNIMSSFEKSAWFSRGWTLQELIAPLDVVFYSKEGIEIGTKSRLIKRLQHITGIDAQVLKGAEPNICSIASRMSWAARRRTTRDEDIAYSLLGIFNINMPLLYGEGEKSFLRLQEEIMKTSDDQSLFAWKFKDLTCQPPYTGLLARHPKHFEDLGKVSSVGLWNWSEPSSLTSKGLHAHFSMIQRKNDRGLYYASLECKVDTPQGYPITEAFVVNTQLIYRPTIVLQLISVFGYGKQYIRVHANVSHKSTATLSGSVTNQDQTIYVRQDLFEDLPPSRFSSYLREPDGNDLFWIRGTTDFQFTEPTSYDKWNYQTGIFSLPPSQTGRVLVIHCAQEDRKVSLLFKKSAVGSVCRLDDPKIVTSHPDSHKISGFDTVSQYMLWRVVLGKRSEMFATARVSQSKDFPRPLTVITLCLKTILDS